MNCHYCKLSKKKVMDWKIFFQDQIYFHAVLDFAPIYSISTIHCLYLSLELIIRVGFILHNKDIIIVFQFSFAHRVCFAEIIIALNTNIQAELCLYILSVNDGIWLPQWHTQMMQKYRKTMFFYICFFALK